jgi:transcriptional regulator with XRE-family HTH domain
MGRTPVQVTGSGNPTVRRRELGALLRTLRVEADMTIEQVAEQLLCSPSKVSRMETGLRGTSQRDIRDLCAVYDVTDPAQRDHLAALAKGGREQAWWQPYDLPSPFATYIGLEAEATHIRAYQPGVVPGLLQVPDYARAIHESSLPRLADPEIEERIQVRANRQKILTRKDPSPPQYRVIIDEAVLHRMAGSPAVMHAQMDRIIRASELPNVTVQILAYAAGPHPALDSNFILLDFQTPVPTVVYVEGLVGFLYLERPQDVERYTQIFERLRSLSLHPRESVDVMTRLMSVYERG